MDQTQICGPDCLSDLSLCPPCLSLSLRPDLTKGSFAVCVSNEASEGFFPFSVCCKEAEMN